MERPIGDDASGDPTCAGRRECEILKCGRRLSFTERFRKLIRKIACSNGLRMRLLRVRMCGLVSLC